MESRKTDILIQNRNNLVNAFVRKREFNLLESFSAILDQYFYHTFENSITAVRIQDSGECLALMALGGYGREEQCIHSDIDLLILFQKKIPDAVEAVIRETIYPLWDAGFEVGYAVRTVEEAIALAFERFDVLTTILDARFLWGEHPIFKEFMEKFRNELCRKHLKQNFKNLIEHGEKRHSGFGDSTYLLEPNLKSGHGGLRDYHTILWYAKIKSGIEKRRDLEYCGFLSHGEYQRLTETLGFIWEIRNWLHYLSKRKCDQLHFEHQLQIAALLGFEKSKGQQGVEIFMGRLHTKMEFIKHINQLVSEDIFYSGRRRGRISPAKRVVGEEGLTIRDKRLNFSGTVHVIKDPALLIKIFYRSGKTKIPLSFEAQRIVTEFRHLVDKHFRKDQDNIEMFRKILFFSFWEFNVLNVMLSTGILRRFVPEFATIVNKIQFNQYHLFPVDKHSIRCVQIVNSFRRKKNQVSKRFYSNIYGEIKVKKTLLTAALFHDIGKGIPGGQHSVKGAKIVGKALARMNCKASEIDDIKFLVRYHLFLVKIATRRDISDEETAVFCANTIKTVDRLRMLYLLSVADSMATGPKAWNDWTETLLKDLFLKVLNIMKSGELASRKASRLIETKKNQVIARKSGEWGRESLERDIASMSRRYLLYTPVGEIARHIDLYKSLGDKTFKWYVAADEESGIRTVTICGRNKPGFYSKVAGVFFLNNLDIVASEAHSWGRNAVLDIFKVIAPKDRIREAEKWKKASEELNLAIKDDTFLESLHQKIPRVLKASSGQIIKPNHVKIDNLTSSFFTIIEVYTYDFPGLLFAVTNCLYKNRIEVRVAKVATKVDQVIDIFYVQTCEDEEKINSSEQQAAVKKSILDILPAIDAKETLYEED